MTHHAIASHLPPPLKPAPDMIASWGEAELGYDAAVTRILDMHTRDGARRDLVVPDLRTWSIVDQGRQFALMPLDGNHSPRPLRSNAFSQLMTRLRVPGDFVRRMPAPLQLAIANYALLAHDESSPVTLRIRGEHVTAVVSDRYAPLDPIEFVETLRASLKQLGLLQDVRVRGVASGLVDNLRLVLPSEQAVLKPGDVSALGLDVSTSAFGRASLQISPVVYRLICSNGMRRAEVNGQQLSFRHVGDSRRLKEGLAAAVPAALSGARGLMNQWVRSVSFMVENVKDRISGMRELSVPEKQRIEELVLLESGGRILPQRVELYSLINAVTASAKSAMPARRLELEAAAGHLLVQHVGSAA